MTSTDDSTETDSENGELLHTGTIEDGHTYVPRQIIEDLDLEEDGLIRWYLTEDGDVSIEFDHQRTGVFDDDDMKAPMGGDALETHDLAGEESRSAGRGMLVDDDVPEEKREEVAQELERRVREQRKTTEESDFSDGFGRWEDSEDLFRECPICGTEVYEGKVGGHLDQHWDEIVELVEDR
ncbi:AbrB family transcriptional regulator [Halosimplex carlsbadense 2-9-1]|uniref:AbrB family transcriptional regulator n=1 Tax=Halosimplex carlsbadense 2-9-1 TaxID=797114 RepID=M0CI73_9EURY|nr:hypothetical protein [Halosimplex carlsbadense]ELZ21574.1 AbrB family transcriptional regulator [Halosimplex carlsbadense 2-9-1]